MTATAQITKRSTMQQILEAAVPRYEMARTEHGKAMLRPLRSVVSQAAGCTK